MEEQLEALKTANEYIDNLKNGVNSLVDKINSGEENSGIALIPLIADGLDWLINVIKLTKDLHKGTISVENSSEILEQIIEALDNEDYVLLGDLFNYEFLPILENIQLSIRSVLSK
ncbi:hypothetical protein [Clostridium beijerinckii]|uniref:hypothetical protein n=1 Tax=Clostridium beijerinckii TaxID=1520 RepID=UPI00156DBA22|nr:hypothetical protein [Clostridium beijerinckii]NRT73716.1 hypothetical protein [Clostridium beijerinckii]